MSAPAVEEASASTSAATTGATTTQTGAGEPGGPVPSRRRRWALPLVAAALVAVTGLVTALIVPTGNRDALDPRSTAQEGTRAVARVLEAHGVTVDLVRRSDAAVDGADGAVTIVVVQPTLLGPQQLARLRSTRADLVLVEPDLTVLAALAPGLAPAGDAPAHSADPGCADPDAAAAGTATGGGSMYRAAPGAPAATTLCYREADGRAAFARSTTGEHRVTVIGQPQILENGWLARDGDAALAVRALGAHPALRWYLPDPAELAADTQPTASSLLPPWVRWVFWQLVIAVLVILLWRARRLGRVVTEPLPVVVRSAETVEGRARLYRQNRARGRAAAVLRRAALHRLAIRLGVGVTTDPQEIARLAVAATGEDSGPVREGLLGAEPTGDAELVRLATALDDLERRVATASATGPSGAGYGGARRGGDH